MYSKQRHSEGYAGVKSPLGLVIPCYNKEAALPHLLASLETIQKESNIPISVLLVDGGSQESRDCNRRSRLRSNSRGFCHEEFRLFLLAPYARNTNAFCKK
jgi:hypothetical protein